MKISVVIPVYNSQNTLKKLVAELEPPLRQLASEFEVILVNDGSKDQTKETLAALASERSWVKPINLMRNFGQHNAVLCGIRAAQYPVVITMDDDLQHPPSQIYKLLDKLSEGFDVVYGTPAREQHGFLRDSASKLTKWAIQQSMGVPTARDISAFRAFRTPLRNAFAKFEGPFVSIDALLTWGTSKFGAVSVEHRERQVGASNYSLLKLIQISVNVITGFSTLPLRLATFNGCFCLMLGAVLFAYILGRYVIQGCDVPGFPFIASVILVFSGAQLFALGIIGEYLARMYVKSMAKPTFVIEDTQEEAELQGMLKNLAPEDFDASVSTDDFAKLVAGTRVGV
ncbi:MAG TPA: glycosyltransferase family 2 protein [Drouetiella sp.]